MKTGILEITDLLAVDNRTVLDFGIERVQAAIQAELAAHNAQMLEMVSFLARPTQERSGTYGVPQSGELLEVDQYGRAPTQKTGGAAGIHYPLRKYQFNLGWTANFAKLMTPADMALQTQNAQRAHRVGVIREIKRALFPPTNYEFTDFLIDNYELQIKRLLNGDGDVVPSGPNGETFDGSTHSHYNAIDWDDADEEQRNVALRGLVNDVVEHGHGSRPILVIARGDEDRIAATSEFEPYKPVQIVSGSLEDRASGTLQTGNLYNRAIGVLRTSGAEVWVKPWGVQGYVLTTDVGAPTEEKPLAFRQRPQTAAQGLQVVAMIDAHPLVAEYMEAEFGFGVHQRTNGAVLYLGGDTYVAPSI